MTRRLIVIRYNLVHQRLCGAMLPLSFAPSLSDVITALTTAAYQNKIISYLHDCFVKCEKKNPMAI